MKTKIAIAALAVLLSILVGPAIIKYRNPQPVYHVAMCWQSSVIESYSTENPDTLNWVKAPEGAFLVIHKIQ